jgi:rhomboid protease GluP
VRVSTPTVKPYVTYILLAVTVFIYLLQVGTQYLLGTDLPFQLGAKYGPLIRLGEIWRLITPVFLHASLLHIGFNMYALVIYGRGLEARFGHGRLLLYFLSAYAGNVLSFLLVPNPSLGASTAIFGLLAAEAIFLIKNRGLLGNRINATLLNLLFIAGYNLFIGFTSQGVDNFGHIGGLLGGLLFTWFGGPRWKVEGIYPVLSLVDEREGHGALAGTTAVLLFFIPLTALGWIWVVK